jgi:hypothetical protein
MTRIASALAVMCAMMGCSRLPSEPASATAQALPTDAQAAERENYRQRHVTPFATSCFPRHGEALRTAEQLLALVENRAGPEALGPFIGREVVFVGGCAPPGGNADLMVADGVRLAVVIKPAQDVRPQSVTWEACVLGIVRHIDREKKVITIEARPEDWRVADTM